MSGFIEGVDRDQVTLFPERLEDWIGEDHLVRVVDLFVDQLDLVGLGFARAAQLPHELRSLALSRFHSFDETVDPG